MIRWLTVVQVYSGPPCIWYRRNRRTLTTWEWLCRWRLRNPPPSSTGRSRWAEWSAASRSWTGREFDARTARAARSARSDWANWQLRTRTVHVPLLTPLSENVAYVMFHNSKKVSIPRTAVAQIPDPNSPSLPPFPFVMLSTFSFPSHLLPNSCSFTTPVPSTVSWRPLGTTPEKIANLNVHPCNLICIVYVENSHWVLCKTWIYCHYLCFRHKTK